MLTADSDGIITAAVGKGGCGESEGAMIEKGADVWSTGFLMTATQTRPLLVSEARHDNGWTSVVTEQPDGTFLAVGWSNRDSRLRRGHSGSAQAGALFALQRTTRSDHRQRGPRHGEAEQPEARTGQYRQRCLSRGVVLTWRSW